MAWPCPFCCGTRTALRRRMLPHYQHPGDVVGVVCLLRFAARRRESSPIGLRSGRFGRHGDLLICATAPGRGEGFEGDRLRARRPVMLLRCCFTKRKHGACRLEWICLTGRRRRPRRASLEHPRSAFTKRTLLAGMARGACRRGRGVRSPSSIGRTCRRRGSTRR